MYTGSFANVLPGVNLENIKLGQIFGSSKNGSWALVDAHNFFFFDFLIRAHTGSFANVFGGATLKNIKLGQIFGSSKNGSWALVDARNFFFFDLLIRAHTGSFANVYTGSFANVLPGVNLENIKLGQIFGSSKNGSWALVDARYFFFLIY